MTSIHLFGRKSLLLWSSAWQCVIVPHVMLADKAPAPLLLHCHGKKSLFRWAQCPCPFKPVNAITGVWNKFYAPERMCLPWFGCLNLLQPLPAVTLSWCTAHLMSPLPTEPICAHVPWSDPQPKVLVLFEVVFEVLEIVSSNSTKKLCGRMGLKMAHFLKWPLL